MVSFLFAFGERLELLLILFGEVASFCFLAWRCYDWNIGMKLVRHALGLVRSLSQ